LAAVEQRYRQAVAELKPSKCASRPTWRGRSGSPISLRV
jgi:hypothetical protein